MIDVFEFIFLGSDAWKLMGGMLVCFGSSCKRKACEISSVVFDCTPVSLKSKKDLLLSYSLQRTNRVLRQKKAPETPFFFCKIKRSAKESQERERETLESLYLCGASYNMGKKTIRGFYFSLATWYSMSF